MMLYGPISVLSYLQILARQGILIKDGRVLESVRQVDTVVFDKTGTLTLEQPAIGKIHLLAGYDEQQVLYYAASAEFRQSHPIAKAIVDRAQQHGVTPPHARLDQLRGGLRNQSTLGGKVRACRQCAVHAARRAAFA
jgi:Cu2+-exporting ATPase